MFGHTLGTCMGMGYIKADEPITAEYIAAGTYEIEVAAERFPARASLRPFYDPQSERVKS